jgi:hypothetical protein
MSSKKTQWSQKMRDFLVENHAKMTYDDLTSTFNKKFKTKLTVNAIRKAYERYQYNIVNIRKKEEGPKILLLDIETSPLLANVWGLWNNNVSLNQLREDWFVLSWAAKWYDSDKIIYMDQRNKKDYSDDKAILKKMWKLLDEADIVITHNGKKFDIKRLFSRFVLNGMQPPSSFRNIDTLVIAKRHFGFTSNKLAFLTDKLCTKYKKLSHGKYPGQELWTECMKGNIDAWKEMEEYNRYDVLSLQELYEVLIPWDDSINFSMYFEDHTCSCGSTNLKKSGFYYTNASKYQRYKCTDCGSEFRDKKNLRKNDKTKTNRRG